MNIKFRVLSACAYALICVFLWWVSGYDFNERDGYAGICATMTIMAFAFGLTSPLTSGK